LRGQDRYGLLSSLGGHTAQGQEDAVGCFFEPNGLRHREFVLREEPDTSIIGLDWNVESDLLAVTLRAESCDKVQLWHRSNYHWYLQKEFRYAGRRVACASFHEEQPYLLYVVFQLDFEWREYRGSVRTLSNSCIAFAIDGCRRLCTYNKIIIKSLRQIALITLSDSNLDCYYDHRLSHR
jgi:hypothetical protein